MLLDAHRALPQDRRRRINVASPPMLQHHAHVVGRESLEEGFGLTVTEAMWKARPVVASEGGGIREQVEDGRTGVMPHDPSHLDAVGDAVAGLVDGRERADRLGEAGRRNGLDHVLHDRRFARDADLLDERS